MTSILETALSMLNRGYTPVPLKGKIPQVDKWQTLAGVTREQVSKWHKDGLLENVGLVCGAASSNIVVLDFDGMAAYAAFCELFPELVETYTVLSGSGLGKHCYYKVDRLPDGSPKATNTPLGNIEVCGNGRQVVVVPSIHPKSGKPYTVAKAAPTMQVESLDNVVAWVKSFKGKAEWQPPKQHTVSTGNLNPQVMDALRQHFERQQPTQHGDWLNVPCPNTPAHKHGDTTPSFGYNMVDGTGNCYVCGGLSTKQLCEYVGIDWKALGGLFERSETGGGVGSKAGLANAPATNGAVQASNGHTKESVPILTLQPMYISSKDALMNYGEAIEHGLQDGTPLVIPWNFLHQYGGFAHIMTPGKLAYFASTSGGGKTIILETGWEALQRQGVDSIVYSPEWADSKGIELSARAIQRNGGTSYMRFQQHLVSQAIKGQGQELNAVESQQVYDVLGGIRQWKGQCFYITKPGLSVEKLNEQVRVCYEAESLKGRKIQAVFLDFAQLLWLDTNSRDGQNWIEAAIGKFKETCRELNLVGFVSSQMRKSDAEYAKGGADLDAGMMQWLSEQQCNLGVIFAPKVDALKRRVSSMLRARIFKNSMYEPKADEFDIAMDYVHLRALDAPESTAHLQGVR